MLTWGLKGLRARPKVGWSERVAIFASLAAGLSARSWWPVSVPSSPSLHSEGDEELRRAPLALNAICSTQSRHTLLSQEDLHLTQS